MSAENAEIIRDETEIGSEPIFGRDAIKDTQIVSNATEDASEDNPVVLVDQPGPVDIDWMSEIENRTKNRLPIVPLWLKSKQDALSVVSWLANHYAYLGAYHATRSPKYLGKLAAQSPIGLAKAAKAAASWPFDTEGKPVRRHAAESRDAEQYLRLSKAHDVRVRNRLLVSLSAAVVLALGTVLAMDTVPTYGQWLAVSGLVALLGLAGTPADKQVFDRAVMPTQVQKLTSDIVLRALGSLGIGELSKSAAKGGAGITFPSPITRDGPGWRADVDLPFGVTTTDIMSKRERLASALRRPLGCVWPEPANHLHPGRLVLWVGDQDMNKAKKPTWPLMKTGKADLFQPVPFGTDQRGRIVSIPLMYRNMLIGAMPGFGKTFALRVLLLAAALDPSCEMRIFELKGTGDLKPLSKVAHHYASGAKDSTIEECV
ncbi:cell division protein FtsK, partial [Sphaerisporangium sp. NPDC088356]